jgi:hypothetical protein
VWGRSIPKEYPHHHATHHPPNRHWRSCPALTGSVQTATGRQTRSAPTSWPTDSAYPGQPNHNSTALCPSLLPRPGQGPRRRRVAQALRRQHGRAQQRDGDNGPPGQTQCELQRPRPSIRQRYPNRSRKPHPTRQREEVEYVPQELEQSPLDGERRSTCARASGRGHCDAVQPPVRGGLLRGDAAVLVLSDADYCVRQTRAEFPRCRFGGVQREGVLPPRAPVQL